MVRRKKRQEQKLRGVAKAWAQRLICDGVIYLHQWIPATCCYCAVVVVVVVALASTDGAMGGKSKWSAAGSTITVAVEVLGNLNGGGWLIQAIELEPGFRTIG
jgi:hypothetical protein